MNDDYCPYCSNSVEVWEYRTAELCFCPHCGATMPAVEVEAWLASAIDAHLEEEQNEQYFPDPDDPKKES